MTVSTTNSRVSHVGDGVTVAFTFPYYFLANADLKVYLAGALKTLTTDYSISGAGVSAGGTITFVSAPANLASVVVVRDPDTLQSASYPSNDPFPSSTHERVVDKLTMLVQRIKDILTRAAVLSDTDTSGASPTLPSPGAGLPLRWNIAGTALETYTPEDVGGNPTLQTALANTSDAAKGDFYIGVKRTLTGAVATTLHAYIERQTLSASSDFLIDNTGATDASAAINAAIVAMPNNSVLKLTGTFKVNSQILMPYSGVNGSGKILDFDGATFVAGANNAVLIHWAECRGGTIGHARFDAGGFTGVSGFRVTPTDETSSIVLANQNFNTFGADMDFIGLDEGVVLQAGAQVAGTDSGCWYNRFAGVIDVRSCKRGIWLKDGNLGTGSGPNSNSFPGGVVCNGSMNTGIQIDAGGGNVFFFPQMENITTGSSPNATPTGLIVANLMANGNANPDNTFYSAHWENCTRNALISNPDTKIYATDTDLFNCSGTITQYTEQSRLAVSQKGQLVNAIYKIVATPAQIRGLWLFDEYGSAVQINDRSGRNHAIDLRNAALATQAANLWGPRINGAAFGLTYGDESHLWDTVNHSDFNFGDGATDSAFSISTLIYPTLATACEVVSKDDLTTASTKRQYALELETNGSIAMFLHDNSAAAYIARTAPPGSIVANTLQLLTVTYDGSSTAAGIKIYVNALQVDNATLTDGVYTAMEVLSARPAGYRISTAGVPERFYKGRLFATMMLGEALTATMVRQLSYLLRSYAGGSLS